MQEYTKLKLYIVPTSERSTVSYNNNNNNNNINNSNKNSQSTNLTQKLGIMR